MAAEGGLDYVNNNIRTIRIASNNQKEREFYCTLFGILGIRSKLYRGRHNVVINGIPNFIRCKELDLFKLHERKNKKFLEAFNDSLSIRLFLLLKKMPLSKKDIIRKLIIENKSQLDAHLRSLMQLGYLKKAKDKYNLCLQ